MIGDVDLQDVLRCLCGRVCADCPGHCETCGESTLDCGGHCPDDGAALHDGECPTCRTLWCDRCGKGQPMLSERCWDECACYAHPVMCYCVECLG